MTEKEQIKINGTILFKRGTQADLEADNSIIDNGEPVFEIDTKKLKIGNGELTYIELPYIGGNDWCEEQIAQLTLRVGEAEETIEAFLRDAEVGSEAVDTLKEIQASLDAGEVSAANLLNKVNELEAVHETYVEEHKKIKEEISQEITAREAQDKLLFDSATQEHQAIRNEINSRLQSALSDRAKIREEFAAADSVVTTALNEEISRAQTAETDLDARLGVIEGTGEGSIKKAQADAQVYADTQITNLVDSAQML